jgi:hypothetical protein
LSIGGNRMSRHAALRTGLAPSPAVDHARSLTRAAHLAALGAAQIEAALARRATSH